MPDRELSEEYLKELAEGPPGDFLGYDYRGLSLLILPQGWGEEGEGMTLEEAVNEATAVCQDATDELWEVFDSIGQ